jgi:hypothetical protein
VLVGVAVIVLVITSLGGSSKKGQSATVSSAQRSPSAGHSKTRRRATSKQSKGTPAPNAAETNVAVLNGTETTGLAHRVSGNLQQRGYSQATALSGRPPGANQVTTVEYASGHQGEAQGVASSLSVSQVQPMEAAVASLAGSAKVVVIVGADKAATVP